jgi:DNA modification methylase
MTIHHRSNSIFHADYLTALPQPPAVSVNFVLTDPPYITSLTTVARLPTTTCRLAEIGFW